MIEKNEKYLPIGTVVLLKNAKKRVMITGYNIKMIEQKDKVWDYSACLYPEGVISSDKNLVFNHDDINTIYSLGFIDNEFEQIKPLLVSIRESIDSNIN